MSGPRKGVIKEHIWRSLDEVSNAAKREHSQKQHENTNLPGEQWMMCDEPLCKEYRAIFDLTDVRLTNELASKQKRREKAGKK